MTTMNLHVNCWDAYNQAMNEAKILVAVDAGANDGGYTHTLVEHGFFVHAFEPVPRMFKKLHDRHGANLKVECHQLGLSDCADTIRDVTVLECWTIGKSGQGGLSVSPDFKTEKPFDLHTITLDSMTDMQTIGVGIIKLDVDGYEFKVLRGAEKTIRQWKPAILCEFGKYLSCIGDDPKAFVNFIFELGYNVVSMDGKSVFTTWEQVQPQWPYNTTFDVMLMPV